MVQHTWKNRKLNRKTDQHTVCKLSFRPDTLLQNGIQVRKSPCRQHRKLKSPLRQKQRIPEQKQKNRQRQAAFQIIGSSGRLRAQIDQKHQKCPAGGHAHSRHDTIKPCQASAQNSCQKKSRSQLTNCRKE